jgi:hypothetical protein
MNEGEQIKKENHHHHHLPMNNTTSERLLPQSSTGTTTAAVRTQHIPADTFTPHDVVLGKGNGINNLPGNVRFRMLIDKYKPLYAATARSAKGNIAELVLKEIATLHPPGRFLEPSPNNNNQQPSSHTPYIFREVSRKRAKEKTCQALREKPSTRKDTSSSTTTTVEEESATTPPAWNLLEQSVSPTLMEENQQESLSTSDPTTTTIRSEVRKPITEIM